MNRIIAFAFVLNFAVVPAALAEQADSFSVDLVFPSAPGCEYMRLDMGRLEDDGLIDMSANSMAHVPAINQSSLNICYSATAAQLVDAWRFSHGDKDYGKVTSYLAAAIDTGEDPDLVEHYDYDYRFIGGAEFHATIDRRRKDIDWGQMSDVLDYLAKGRACDVRELNKGIGASDQGKLLEDLRSAHAAYILWQLASAVGNQLGLGKYVIDGAVKQRVAEGAAMCMKNIGYGADQIPQISDLVKLLDQGNPMLFVQKEVDAACKKGRYSPKTPKPQTFVTGTPDGYRKHVDELFARKNPQPIGISFCGNIMKEGAGYKSSCWGHAAVLMGRRFNPESNQCELLVRNSWGPSCGMYAKDVKCEGNGNFWVSSDLMMKNTRQLTNLE
ncbi:MAG: hypothetical protein HY075_03170 [Deltaproteobacteria bacterium]|nr:hypothetical protein [Deltaproteobacteria bacterium]